ncbi:MAG TPA: hypothetical protein VFS44_02280 [Gemmatimonadaceae bacterium]|nr:hypothetical protein [Gemmatimonadaceae bacterium]
MARETMMWAIVLKDPERIYAVYHARSTAAQVRDEQYGKDYSVRRVRVILDDAEEAREG